MLNILVIFIGKKEKKKKTVLVMILGKVRVRVIRARLFR